MVCVSNGFFAPHYCTSALPIRFASLSQVSLIAIHVHSLGNRGGGYLNRGLLDREERERGSKSPNTLLQEEIY